MLTLGSSMILHIHQSVSHHDHTCCTGRGFRLPSENTEVLGEEVGRELKVQDMVPTHVISDIAGHGSLQLLKHLCSLFAFVSPYQACVCIHVCVCVACVCVSVCVCVQPREKAEIKTTGEEKPSSQKRRHKVFPV